MRTRLDRRRRWAGAIFLGLAMVMLIAGQTVLRGALGPIAFILYWLLCFVFTCLAMMIALVDISSLRRRTREEQRELLEGTLAEIARRERDRRRPRQ